MRASNSKLSKITTLVMGATKNRAVVKRSLNAGYHHALFAKKRIPTMSATDLLGGNYNVYLSDFFPRDGNVSLMELVVICCLCRKIDPKVVVEIGTFDGNTTLQLALNTSRDSRIYTLDLPLEVRAATDLNDRDDEKFIVNTVCRRNRRFLGTHAETKIIQFYGDSLDFDFDLFARAGQPDLIFIDAGHSYKCVKNDTEKALSILKPRGWLIWQDYSANWPGVFNYLEEISTHLELSHIAETSLVIYQSR
jgi:hypothetical protein